MKWEASDSVVSTLSKEKEIFYGLMKRLIIPQKDSRRPDREVSATERKVRVILLF